METERLPVEADGDASGRACPDDRFRKFGSSGSNEPGEAEDFAWPDGESCVAGKVHLENGIADWSRRLGRIKVAERTANHEVGDLSRVSSLGDHGRDLGPVAQYGNSITNRADFGETMRNVKHGNATLELSDQLEQSFRLRLAEDGRWLIHDEDRGIDRNRLCDLHKLLARDRQFLDFGSC